MNQLNKRIGTLESRAGATKRKKTKTKLVKKNGRLWLLMESIHADGSIHQVRLPDNQRYRWPREMLKNVAE